MEEMRKMNARPHILLQQHVALDKIMEGAAPLLEVPPSNVFENSFPEYANYDLLFDQGYLIVHSFEKGVFGTRLDGFFDSARLTRENMVAISDALGTLVCVDFSVSELESNFEAYFRGRAYSHVKVSALEDRNSEPYYESQDVRDLLERSVG
jgi:hypothetical protein